MPAFGQEVCQVPISVDNGVDVAGTINGEAATGSGQILTGDDGENNVDGLVMKYTGTAEGLDVGDVKINSWHCSAL